MLLTRLLDRVARTEGPTVLAGLIRLTGDFDAAEDALQEAYARALEAWTRDGVPDRPAAWLNTVARRVAIDRFRRDRTVELSPDRQAADAGDPQPVEDDRLRLLFVCCHPALAPDVRCALALRSLGGLTTREIARAFLEPEATTAQRLVRAKRKIREARIPFEIPVFSKLPERVDTVLSVLYFIFNEGYTATDEPSLVRPDLAAEAIRLARLTVDLMPDNPEAQGLLALMLLTDARRGARLTPEGELVTLEDQDRRLWDRRLIEEGSRILDAALTKRTPGPYQTQAAIAALHASAPAAAATDWRQIAALYQALRVWTPTAVVELNAAVALGMATDLETALDRIRELETRKELSSYYLLPAAKADLLRRLERWDEAAAAYRRALALVTNPAERRYLERRLALVSCGIIAGGTT
jgi:RNA polymerase sigma-70 factor (ECF subfamily)